MGEARDVSGRRDGPVSSPALAWTAPAAAGAPVALDPRAAERELVRAGQRGDREAFDRLVERYQRSVYHLCYRYTGGHEDANDLAQETFLRAWRSIGRFRGDSAFSTWLYRIAVNACLNHRAVRRLPTQEVTEALPDPSRGALSRVEGEEEAERVRGAIADLPEKQRATLILKVYHELSHEEVARALGSSVGTVKSNLFHALANLRRRLGAEGRR
jgi:RNA polymerase sigma-70 factor (ECF subfamily)